MQVLVPHRLDFAGRQPAPDCEADGDPRVSPVALKRLAEMLDFIETMSRWYTQMIGVPKAQLVRLIKMGSKVVGLLSIGRGKGRARRDEAAGVFFGS